MAGLRRLMKAKAPLFEAGGRWQRFYPLYEMVDTFLYWTPKTTAQAPHIRDGLDIKRVMSYVVVATAPCVLMSWFNTGYQANTALSGMGLAALPGWRGALTASLGVSHDPASVWACVWLGFVHFLPLYLVTLIAGGLWEVLFATVRGHDVNEGFFVSSILYTLSLPPDIPLWMVALGISFGVVIDKEVFGGTGKNFLNPTLTGRAFLFFAYPAFMSRDEVWVPVDRSSRATPLAAPAPAGREGVARDWPTCPLAFLGVIRG